MIRYRVIQHFGQGFKPIYATLELEGVRYTAPEKIKEETRSVQTGNWITASEETIPNLRIGPWAFAGSSEGDNEETQVTEIARLRDESAAYAKTLIKRGHCPHHLVMDCPCETGVVLGRTSPS